MESKQYTLIGAPFDLGSPKPGAALGPAAVRRAGLSRRLQALGHTVEDAGDIAIAAPAATGTRSSGLEHLDEAHATCARLRATVEHELERGRTPVVLGGDHSIAMGTIAGLSRYHARRGMRIGVIWFDAHGDANTPESSPSGNIHGMPLAVALGLGMPDLVALGGGPAMLDGVRTSLVGLRDVDPGERAHLLEAGVSIFDMRDIDERGIHAVMEQAIERSLALPDTAGIHVSIDMDCLDPAEAPGVGTPSPGGLSYRDACMAMEMLTTTGKVISAELVEVNPLLDSSNQTVERAVTLLATLLAP